MEVDIRKSKNPEAFARMERVERNIPGRKSNSSRKFLIAIAVLIMVGLAGMSYYFYSKYQKAIKNPSEVSRDEARGIASEIGKFMDLPNEDPTLATITDTEKLKDQPFFAKAQNGDKVLVYSNAKEAILYRPSTHHVIQVTSLTGGE